MHKISKIYSFYIKAFLIVLLINLVLFFSLGTYFEEYEGTLSTFVHGTYTNYAIKEWNVDVHFFLFWIYAYINQFFPNIQVYGIVLFILNWSGLVFFGLALFRVLKVNVKNESIILFVLLYLIIAIDYIINLGSTRISFLVAVTIFVYIQSCFYEQKKLNIFLWILLFLTYFFISLMRAEVVLLVTLCYSIILIIHSKFSKHVLLFLLVSISVIFAYNFVATHYLSEARQVFYYKEFDFLDKDNINYSTLSAMQLMVINAFKNYLITDKEHFTYNFYDLIIRNKSRFDLVSFYNTFFKSIYAFMSSWQYILLAIISGGVLLMNSFQSKIRRVLFFLFVIFFPVFLCFYLVIPQRFLMFYYSIIAILNLVQLVNIKKFEKCIVITCVCFVILFFYLELDTKNRYKKVDDKVHIASDKLNVLSSKVSNEKPIIINTIEYMGRYFPVNPFQKLHRQNVMFLNFWYYGAYDCYLDKWKDNCNCNPLSIKEKVDYIVSNQNIFITDSTTFNFMQTYFKLKYNKVLLKKEIKNFDGDLKICNLNYGN